MRVYISKVFSHFYIMNQHPVNLAIRFLLEMSMLIIFAYWAWHRYEGFSRFLFGLLFPLAGAILWTVFRVDGDPGKAIISVEGWVRLLLECSLFGIAFYMLLTLKMHKWAYIFLGISILHYMVSYDRIRWLLKL